MECDYSMNWNVWKKELWPSTFGKRNPAEVECWHSNIKSDAPTTTLTPTIFTVQIHIYLTIKSFYCLTYYCVYKIGPSPTTTHSFFVTLVHEDKVFFTRFEPSQYSAVCSGISAIFTLLCQRSLPVYNFVITGNDELPRRAVPGRW